MLDFLGSSSERESGVEDEAEYAKRRKWMVRTQLKKRGITDARVLEAMREVPRHRFVPSGYRAEAYQDRPIPIGERQTISQPYVVALMSQALGLEGDERVLEIGTGSGYQAAVLSRLAAEVYTVERYASLARRAEQVFDVLGYENVHVKVGDGTQGWAEQGPFQAIIVTAAAPDVPNPLKAQLDDGGCLIVPVGSKWSQRLVRITRRGEQFEEHKMTGVRFVPLVGEHGWQESENRRDDVEGNGVFHL